MGIKNCSQFGMYDAGMYFVTICSKEREMAFGTIQGGKFFYTPLGKIARSSMRDINSRFPQFIVESAVIMPNHIHLVISVYESSEVGLGDVIRNYKSLVTQRYRRQLEKEGLSLNGKRVWQRNYDEQIIRTDLERDIVTDYVTSNIEKWPLDQHYCN